MKPAKTIRAQLTRKLLLTLTGGFTIGGLAIYLSTKAALQAQFDITLKTRTQALSNVIEQKNGAVEIDWSDEYMQVFEKDKGNLFEVTLLDGTLLGRSRVLTNQQLSFKSSGPMEIRDIKLAENQSFRALKMQFSPHMDDSPQAAVAAEAILVVACSREEIDRMLLTLLCVLSGCGVLGLTAMILIVPRVLRRELSPLQRLAEQTACIDANSLSSRFAAENLPGELAPITARLNDLLSRMQTSFERERQFSSDVAHEFRTPVAELRAMAELAARLPESRPENFEQEVLAIALHLEGVLTQLLALARGERNQLIVEREKVFLDKLVEEVCRKFLPRAAKRKLAFEGERGSNIAVDTDPILLQTIVANLVGNAVEYSPAGGSVRIEVTGAADLWALRVINSVEDLAPQDLPCLFERFWRKDLARSPDGHSGLGLSLARAFAGAIGCELFASFIGPNRLAMTLAFQRRG